MDWRRTRGLFLAAVCLMATGCGGISGSHSVSPASFFLPGLLQAEPPAPRNPAAEPAPADANPPLAFAR